MAMYVDIKFLFIEMIIEIIRLATWKCVIKRLAVPDYHRYHRYYPRLYAL